MDLLQYRPLARGGMLHDLHDSLIDLGLEFNYLKRVNIDDERRTFLLAERDELEEQTAQEIEAALQVQLAAILDNPQQAGQAINENDGELRRVLLGLLIAAFLLGNDSGLGMLEEVGLSVDEGEAGQGAGRFSQSRINALMGQLNDTTRAAVVSTIAAWEQSGGDLDDLAGLLQKTFNESRAANIATTETTSSFSAGVEAVAVLAGVSIMEWYTMQDERVCPICRPMNGKRRIRGGRYDSSLPVQDTPPAHPRCRCGEVMVIQSILS